MDNKGVKVFLPHNLDLERIIKQYPPKFNYKMENFKLLLDALLRADFECKETFVTLNAGKMKNVVNNYKPYMDYMREQGIIQRDRMYIVGEKSYGYQLMPNYQTKVISTYCKSSIAYKKRQAILNGSAVCKEYPYLTKWFDKNLTIVNEEATLANEQLFDDELSSIDKNLAVRKYNIRLRHIEDFDYEKQVITTDSSGQRLHTILTKMSSHLRQYLHYRNCNLVEVDLKNSAPFFSLMLFKPEFYLADKPNENSITLKEIYPEMYNALFSTNKATNGFIDGAYKILNPHLADVPSIMIPFLANLGDDAKEYQNHVLNGTLYDYFGETVGDYTGENFTARKNLKKEYNKAVFSKNGFRQQFEARYKRVLIETFPSVMRLFAMLKSKDNAHLPILLQRLESYGLLKVIAGKFSKLFPKTPIFSIHDSLIIPKALGQYMHSMMRRELEKIVGEIPQFKISPFGLQFDYSVKNGII